MKKLIYTPLLFLLFSISTLYSLGQEVGEKAPEIELKDNNGKKVKLSDLQGKVVLIDFWASWCGPCRRENPNVVEAFSKYHKSKFINAKGFEVFSVSLDKNEQAWLEAIKKDNLTWDSHVWDKGGEFAKQYKITSIPMAFLIDGEGKIVAKGQDLRGMGLHIEIEKLFK
ncbi:MAG: TlpA family protein disulfide reductase [Crocinitomicaceae bacterium]|jgi:peroxiredoxin